MTKQFLYWMLGKAIWCDVLWTFEVNIPDERVLCEQWPSRKTTGALLESNRWKKQFRVDDFSMYFFTDVIYVSFNNEND